MNRICIKHKVFFFTLSMFLVASCGPKSKTEQVASTSEAKDSLPTTVEKPKVGNSLSIVQPEKKETIMVVTPKKPATPTKPKAEIKRKLPKTPVTVPTQPVAKEAPPVIKKAIETKPTVSTPEKPPPPKADSATAKKPELKSKGKPYYFKVVRKEDGKEISSSLQLQEAIGATQYQLVKSGEVVYLEAPKNRRGSYTIVAMLPGYRQSSLVFVYTNPPIQTGPNNEEIITLTLDKARAGDYIDFNNVRFFLNTSLMRPVSKNELDELANLLKENVNYKIRIYGYCNGTHDRESYTKGTSPEFFALDSKGNKKETISSKELSLARAETVKEYLTQQGIEGSRLRTKGEGGKVPLYPEGGTLGQYNDRVEVEFVKN